MLTSLSVRRPFWLAALSVPCLSLAVDAQTPFAYTFENTGVMRRLNATTGQNYQNYALSSRAFGAAADGQSILTTNFSPSQLERVDIITGVKTVIGPLPALNFRGLEVDPTTGMAYMATDFNGNTLHQVNKSNGNLTLIGSLAGIVGQAAALAINSSGQGYLVSGGFGQPFILWTVNLANASLTSVGAITGTPVSSRFDDLAFDHNDVLHAAHRPSGAIYTLDVTTAIATLKYDPGNADSIAFVTTCPGNIASSANYGAGWPGTSGIPSFAAGNPPAVGTPVVLNIGNSLGATTPGAMFVGTSTASLLTPFGGTLLVSPILTTINITIAGPGSAVTFAVPHDTSGCGLAVHFQCVEVDPGASHGISFTRGLTLNIGS